MTYRPEPAYYLSWGSGDELGVWGDHWLAEAIYQDADNEWQTLISFECVGLASPASHRVMWAAILRHAELPDDERTVAAARARWSGHLRIPAHQLRAGLQVPML